MPDIQPLTADAQKHYKEILTGAFTTANIAIIQAQIAKIIEIATEAAFYPDSRNPARSTY